MTEREALFMVYQFLKHPPQSGTCIFINLKALEDLFKIVVDTLNENEKDQADDRE